MRRTLVAVTIFTLFVAGCGRAKTFDAHTTSSIALTPPLTAYNTTLPDVAVAPRVYVVAGVLAPARLLAPPPPPVDRCRVGEKSRPASACAKALLRRPAVAKAFQRWIEHYWLQRWYDALYNQWLVEHPPPTPVSDLRCPPGGIKYLIESVFGPAAPWFESVAWRESGCQADARNDEGASGVGQLMLPLHNDILIAVCPDLDVALSWKNPDCGVRAAYQLYIGSGTAPWRT